MSEEKSIAAELKDILDVAVAQKADKSDLEGMAKTADLEGVVKSADLDEVKSAQEAAIEAAKSEIREEMEAKFAAVPALQEEKSMEPVASFAKHVSDTGEITNRKTIPLTKATPDGSSFGNIPGSRVDTNPVYQELEIANPFRAYSTIMPVSTTRFKLPDFNGATFAMDGGTVARSAGTSAAVLNEKMVDTNRWVSTTEIARPTLDDIESIRGFISSTIVNAYSKAQGLNAASVLKTNVATGAVAVLPDAVADLRSNARTSFTKAIATSVMLAPAMVLETIDGLIQNLSHAYRPGGTLFVTSQVMSSIQRATAGSGLEFDPVARVQRLWGYQIVANDYLDGIGADDTADGNVIAYFGNMPRALVLAEQQSLVIDEYDQTLPGYNTYYSHGRFANATWDEAGIAALQIQGNPAA